MTNPDLEQESITCPVCHMTSYHPTDVAKGYCGNCDVFIRLVRFSVTFTIEGEQYAVPFYQERPAEAYAQTVPSVWPQAINVLVNDLCA